jgi:hypothetical protein
MFRKWISLCALVAMVGLLMAATSSVASAARSKTLRFTTPVKQEVQHFADTGKKGPSLGDYFTLHGPLHKQGGAVAGKLYAVCTAVVVHPIKFHCVGTFALAGGQITFQGIFHPVGQNNQPPFSFAITGGTNAYQAVRGQVTISTVKGIDHETLHLVL